MSLWVAIGHCVAASPLNSTVRIWDLHNSIPVQVFIILSGFVIFSSIDARYRGYWPFIVERAFRIFPVYLVLLTLSALTLNFALDVLKEAPASVGTPSRIALIETAQQHFTAHLLVHVPLFQGIVPPSQLPLVSYTILGQAWSLSLEWQFYLVAPALFFMLVHLKRPNAQIAALFLVALLLWIGQFMDGMAFFSAGMPMFSIGFLSYFAHKHLFSGLSAQWRQTLIVSGVIFALLFSGFNAIAIIIWMTTFLTIYDHPPPAAAPLKWLLSSPALAQLGRVSYSLYLTHMQVLFICLWFAEELKLTADTRAVLVPIASVGISLVVSDLLQRVVEAPLVSLGKTITGQSRTDSRLSDSLLTPSTSRRSN